MDKLNPKVIVGMSGGVDSSVSAALLKKQGFDVLGVFIHFWKEEEEIEKKSLNDAKKVAKILGIPFEIIDARKNFKNKVVKYFLREYSQGKTPNPCVFCNKNLKFKILLEMMREKKFDFVATGHYAINHKIENRNKKTKKTYQLLEAKDKSKDQSYFLYQLGQKELSKIIFPLGEYSKKEVRFMAKKFGLPVFDKDESQDVCFLRRGTESFLSKNIPMKKGKILDKKGKILGEHQGLSIYTFGQRKGINLGGQGPYYVLSKDEKRNILRVTNEKKDPRLFAKKIILNKPFWTLNEPKMPLKATVRSRYRNLPISAIIKKNKKGEFLVELEREERAVSPGQSAVFYSKKGEVIGGAIIKNKIQE